MVVHLPYIDAPGRLGTGTRGRSPNSGTWTPRCGTRTPRLGTLGLRDTVPRYGTRSPNSGTRTPRLGTRIPDFGLRDFGLQDAGLRIPETANLQSLRQK
jgi:hypothetical protein